MQHADGDATSHVHAGRSVRDMTVNVVGAGLAGSEAALQLAVRGVHVNVFEMRPKVQTEVHKTGDCAELVCSNSLKSTDPDHASGMLKHELEELGSFLFDDASETRVSAGGALAVDRVLFSQRVTDQIKSSRNITLLSENVSAILPDGDVELVDDDGSKHQANLPSDAVIIASGPLTSNDLATWLQQSTGREGLAFYDAAAPIVSADSLDRGVVFTQSRYEYESTGDYLNAPFDKDQYESFINALLSADRVVLRDFETADLFQGCQPIEEIARHGFDAPRHGPLKPVGLIDPRTGRRPWAVVQLRAEDRRARSFNLVGFQTNLTFPEQRRVFRMIPGLENAEFLRYGVMHRNTFIDAPRLVDARLEIPSISSRVRRPVFIAGQVSGTEGYTEAIMSGLYASLQAFARINGITVPSMPDDTSFGSLLSYATDPCTKDYQPMHVNFGVFPPIEPYVKNKGQRRHAYAMRGEKSMKRYLDQLHACGIDVRER